MPTNIVYRSMPVYPYYRPGALRWWIHKNFMTIRNPGIISRGSQKNFWNTTQTGLKKLPNQDYIPTQTLPIPEAAVVCVPLLWQTTTAKREPLRTLHWTASLSVPTMMWSLQTASPCQPRFQVRSHVQTVSNAACTTLISTSLGISLTMKTVLSARDKNKTGEDVTESTTCMTCNGTGAVRKNWRLTEPLISIIRLRIGCVSSQTTIFAISVTAPRATRTSVRVRGNRTKGRYPTLIHYWPSNSPTKWYVLRNHSANTKSTHWELTNIPATFTNRLPPKDEAYSPAERFWT